MKFKPHLAVILLIIASFLFSIAEDSQTPQSKAKIEYENGVMVKKNPRDPYYGEIEFELEEDLCIGSDEDDNSYFYGNINFDVGKEGNIYVLDQAKYRLQKFDDSGNFILSIGRQGQGPGEFRDPGRVFIDGSNRINILDRQVIHIFNAAGKFEKSIKQKLFCHQFNFTDTGNIVCKISTHNKDGLEEEIILMNQNGDLLYRYINCSLPTFKTNNLPFFGRRIYDPSLLFYPWLPGSVIYGHSSEYKLYFIDSSGIVAFIAEKDEEPRIITEKEKNRYYSDLFETVKKMNQRSLNGRSISKAEIKKAFPLPKYKPFFTHLLSDDEGNVYVHRMPTPNTRERVAEFDFFNREGTYHYRVKMAFLPRIIKRGYVYIESRGDEEDFLKIKRYKIKNWEQIKGSSE